VYATALTHGTPAVLEDEITRVKAKPSEKPIRDANAFRIRWDRVSHGKVTLRYGEELRHLSVGQAHNGNTL